jgi:hypothetical protein
VHRGRARGATDPASFYYPWFVQHEKIVDDILRAGRTTSLDVARAVHRAVADRRPRLRYVVGSGAKLLIALRRYVPGEVFQRLYARQLVRMVTRPATPAQELSEAVPRDVHPGPERRSDGAGRDG